MRYHMGLFSKLFNSKKVEVKQMEIKKPVENALIKRPQISKSFHSVLLVQKTIKIILKRS